MANDAQQLRLAIENVPHNNRSLFSNYYLDKRVRERPEWKAADVVGAFDTIAALFDKVQPANLPEAELERRLIQPILDVLGHEDTYTTQYSIARPRGRIVPDYLFFADAAGRLRADRADKPLQGDNLRGVLAVGDAKAWGTSLDLPSGVQRVVNISDNPTVQIDTYIRYSGATWGILTNGERWRLYHEASSKEYDVYYEVDLPALIRVIRSDDDAHADYTIDDFKFFYLFFRRAAFVGDEPWLQIVLNESRTYEQGVSDNLKGQVYEALRYLAQGFLEVDENDLEPAQATLDEIYDNSLIVLYRLLFTLYAESRGLLPLNESDKYRRHQSLHTFKDHIATQKKQPGYDPMKTQATQWSYLTSLWHVMDTGNDEIGVPAYNGGLFDPDVHPFLEEMKVGDWYLYEAVDLLARTEDPQTGTREFVDYRDLDVQHLGSIYEGLLEYQLRYAEEALAVHKEGKREVYVPLDEAANFLDIVEAGEVYLITDKGERKATGSYYTPDYIVQYIVEQTVGPVLDELVEGYTDDDGVITDEPALVKAILDVNVLDPAMGSGHFLVGVTNFIARFLAGLGLSTIEEMDAAEELDYWRRRVVQACVYGVDVNPLAVELAKLSLWLSTVAKGKPLNFLDHHLRPGNSLIGARLEDMQLGGNGKKSTAQQRREREAREAGQVSMMEVEGFEDSMRNVTDLMDHIEELAGEDVEDIREARRIYTEDVREATRPFRRLANVWTARHFGLDVGDDVWDGLQNHLLRNGFALPQYEEILDDADRIADERAFFHWELEFPEVFFGDTGELLDGEAGFDAVAGNPPYLLLQNAEGMRVVFEYARNTYQAARYKIDTYMLFIERGIRLLAKDAQLGYITPNTFLKNKFSSQLRKYILEHARIDEIILIPLQVFPEASVDTCILILERSNNGQTTFSVRSISAPESIEDSQTWLADQSRYIESSNYVFDVADKASVGPILSEIERTSTPLGEIADAYFGIQTYDRDKYVKRHPETGNWKRTLDGTNITRYSIAPGEEYVLVTSGSIKSGGDSEIYEQDKLVVRQIGEVPIAAYDPDHHYSLNTIYNITLDDPDLDILYVLACINSSLLGFYWRIRFFDHKATFPKVKKAFLLALPVRTIKFTTTADQRQHLGDKSRHLYDQGAYDALLTLVEDRLSHEPEQADVVHDVLAYLAKQMIAMHEGKQQVVEDFWLDLEGEAGSPDTFEELQGGMQERTMWRKEEAARQFVEEESWITHYLDETLGWNEASFKAHVTHRAGSVPNLSDLVRVYRKYAGDYRELAGRIERTDALIDQIVYRLYGLTEEEIAIVEGEGEEA